MNFKNPIKTYWDSPLATPTKVLIDPTGKLGQNPFWGKGGGKGGNNVDPASTLTAEQQAYLAQLSGLNGQMLPQTMSTLGGLAYNPQSNYSKMNNWEGEFQAGVVNPAMDQMNQAIDNTKHSSNLHSSANRYAQDQLRSGTMNQLAGLRYDQGMKERSMQLQGLDNAQANQMSALGALSNLSGQALGVQGVENIVSKNPSWLDYLSTGANVIGALK